MAANDLAVTGGGVDALVPDSLQARTRRSQFDVGPGFAGDSNIFITLFNGLVTAADDAPHWSYYPMNRDAFLRKFWKSEPTIAGAVYSMATRGKSLEYNFDGPPNQKTYWQRIANNCEMGKGITELTFLTIVDLLTQDNGFFWELVGPGDPNGPLIGRPTDVLHMDAARCWRTFNPVYPVIYHNPNDGSWHRIHHTRVITGSNMPQPDELARGIGFCALSRALSLARTMRAMQRYKYEKITGTQPGIVYGNGFNDQELRAAVAMAKADSQAEGMIYWNGVPVIINPDADAKVTMGLISLKGLPDGFDWQSDATLYIYSLALAFGVDAREFWPATTSGATKGDATVQHMKAVMKGIADIISTLENAWRQLLPESTRFDYDFTDDEQDLLSAQIATEKVGYFTQLKAAGVMNPKQVELHLIRDDILDPALMEEGADWVDPNPPPSPPQLGPDGQPLPPQLNGSTSGNKPPQLPSGATVNAAPSQDTARLQAAKAAGLHYVRLSQKDIADTYTQLVDALTDIIQSGADGDYSRTKTGAQMRSKLNKLGLQGLNDGLAKGGLEQESLSVDQLDAWKDWKTRTSGYVSSFTKTLYDEDGNEIDARAKAELWANKSLKEIYWKGVELAAPATQFRWVIDPAKEHCDTCLENEDQVLPMSEWVTKGLPQSTDLDCGGYRCGCDLVEA